MFRGNTTAGALLTATRNPAGFDYLRLVLSFGVLAFHCILITQGKPGEQFVWPPPGGRCLPPFYPCFLR